eukprot:jgi/Tetstr1/429471/TSEL_019379.t1
MLPRPVPEDALVDDAPGGATAASIAELEKRLTAQAEALEKRLVEQFEAATAALLARLAPPVQSPPPKGTQPAIPAGAPAPEGGEQGAQEPLPAELDTELEYVDFAYFGQVPSSGLEPPPRDGDEPRLWILTDDDTEWEKRLTAQAEALEKRLAEKFEAATAALLARLAPPVQPPPPKGTQPAIPTGAPAPEGGEQGAQEPLPAELDALDTELEYVDFAAARGLAEQRGGVHLMTCFGVHTDVLFVPLDEMLPYVPAANHDFTQYLARARNHVEAIDKAFRFRLAFRGKLNDIQRVHGDHGALDVLRAQLFQPAAEHLGSVAFNDLMRDYKRRVFEATVSSSAKANANARVHATLVGRGVDVGEVVFVGAAANVSTSDGEGRLPSEQLALCEATLR